MPDGRWRDGLYIVAGAVVGTVTRLPGGPPAGEWEAKACCADWEDVPLGRHDSEREAKRHVEEWVEKYT